MQGWPGVGRHYIEPNGKSGPLDWSWGPLIYGQKSFPFFFPLSDSRMHHACMASEDAICFSLAFVHEVPRA
jgi:hypothetical protein